MADRQTHTIAVLGANGRLSREVARAFHRAGWKVRAVTRSGESVLGPEIETIAADMMNEDDAVRATEGCEFIFNGLNPKYTRWHREVMPMARNVVNAAHRHDAVHIFPGNVYNFGSKLPETLDESTPPSGDHRKAAIRIEAEELFRRAAIELDVQTVVLRAGDYFGSDGRGSWFDLVIAANAASGKVTYPGSPDIVHGWAYLPDLAKAFVRLAENTNGLSKFECFHFEGHNVTGDEMHAAIERAMGRPMKKARLPWPVLRIGGTVWPMWREIWEVSYLWRRPHGMAGDKLEAVIGPLPTTPLDAAVARALDDMGIERPRHRHPARALPTMAA